MAAALDKVVDPRKKALMPVFIVSVGLHVAAAIGAGIWIVAKYLPPPPKAAFVAPAKVITMPAEERDQRMNMAEFDGLAAKPSYSDKIASLRPTAFALPDLPKVPMDQMLPLDPSALLTDQVSSLVGSAGTGSGTGFGGGGAGGLGGGTGMSFFGIESKGKRILLMFDVSGSVKNKADASGVPLSKIKEETIKLIGGLPVNARFGIIQFVRNYKPFNAELVPASDSNKKAAQDWVNQEWSESGMMPKSGRGVIDSAAKGIVQILEAGLAMDPDVIFLISDGSFQRGSNGLNETVTKNEIQDVISAKEKTGSKCAINFIGFEMKDDDRKEMGSMARKSGGTLKEIKK